MSNHLTGGIIRIINLILFSIAASTTIARSWDRFKMDRYWWDDAWAAVAILCLLIFTTSMEISLQAPGAHSSRIKLIVAFIIPGSFYAVTWSSRMSMLLTIIRISVGRTRKFLVWTGILFGITWAVLFAQIWWVCRNNLRDWKGDIRPQCPLGTSAVVAQIITDILSHTILLLTPIRLVLGAKLQLGQKIRIVTIFSTTLIATAISLYHAYALLKWGGLREAVAAVLQCALSLIVSNLSVLITLFFRIATAEEEETAPILSYSIGTATKSFLHWVPLPTIASTRLIVGGAVQQRKDISCENISEVMTNIQSEATQMRQA